MDNIKAKEQFVFNLMKPDDRAGKTTLLYMVYKTIETNTGITINQLKWLLDTEYMISNEVVSGTVAALTSRTLFNCVSRWQPPKASGNQRTDAVHLRVRKDAKEFDNWYAEALREYPELTVFVPPVFASKVNTSQTTVISNSISPIATPH